MLLVIKIDNIAIVTYYKIYIQGSNKMSQNIYIGFKLWVVSHNVSAPNYGYILYTLIKHQNNVLGCFGNLKLKSNFSYQKYSGKALVFNCCLWYVQGCGT